MGSARRSGGAYNGCCTRSFDNPVARLLGLAEGKAEVDSRQIRVHTRVEMERGIVPRCPTIPQHLAIDQPQITAKP